MDRSDKQNITLSVPRDVLHRVKLLAVERRSSVSRLLVQKLEELVSQSDEYERARKRALARLKRPADLGSKGRPGWDRDGLHPR